MSSKLTITKKMLYEAHDGHPMPVPGDFTDVIWKYLQEITDANSKKQYRLPVNSNKGTLSASSKRKGTMVPSKKGKK